MSLSSVPLGLYDGCIIIFSASTITFFSMVIALFLNIAHPGNLPRPEAPIYFLLKEWILNILTKTVETGMDISRSVLAFNLLRVYTVNLYHFVYRTPPTSMQEILVSGNETL